jgi:hypothetical protein
VAAKLSPSPTDFVVTGGRPDSIAARVGDRASVEPIAGSSDLVLVRLPAARGSAREAWQRVHDQLAGGTAVQPVFFDAEGQPQYPTGEVSVRFRSSVSDADLDRFAARHKLRVLRRNEFVPEQVVFAPIGESHYLPDVIAALESSAETRMAWPNTIGKYERV